MDLERIERLVEIFEKSRLSEMELEEEGLRLHLQKPGPGAPVAAPAAGPAPVPAVPEYGAAPEPVEDEDEGEQFPTFDSPMVGTFYTCPAPGEPPFVTVGDTVEEEQPVCIVEAMKLMNEVPAKFAGVIEKILVENGEPVEYGQPLFAVRPLEQ